MSYSCLLYEKQGGVLTITLNRPEVFNAFNDEQSYEMQDALKAAKKDESVRAIIITGAGKAFCSGQDLKAISGTKNRSLSESLYKRYNPIIFAMREMPKPIICRLNGVAAGAGASIALACDFIVSVDTAIFVEAFVNIGLVLDSGGSYFLSKILGPYRSFELATMGNKLSATQAFEWGMVNRIVSAENLDNTVKEIATYYENAPTKAIALMKKMLNKAATADLQTMLQYEAYNQEIAGRSEDYKEGVTAFNEKRKANFKGK